MNKLQYKLMKINPQLYKKQIKQAYQEGHLSELIEIYGPKIFKVLEKEKIYIEINNENYNNYWQNLYNQNFVDYVLKHHIESIIHIPEEMIKDEHLKQYAKYLKNPQTPFPEIFSLNRRILSSDEIIKVLITKINSEDDLDSMFYWLDDEKYLLEIIKIGEEKKLFKKLSPYTIEKCYKSHPIFKKNIKNIW